MSAYFSNGGIDLYHGDCLDVLAGLGSVVDLIVTDPPYGQNFKSGRADNFERIAGDHNADAALAGIAASVKVLRPFRHAYIFGRFDLSALPLTATTELLWDKGVMGSGNLSLPWGPQHEYIQFSVHVPSAANRARGDGKLSARLRKGSVLRSIRANSQRVNRHPTEKPVDILRQLIESSSILGDVVLDPFAGSGSTLVAAALEGRRAIGVEIDERYCEVAAKRISAVLDHQDQLNLVGV